MKRFAFAKSRRVAEGDAAPGFELKDQYGAAHRLAAYRGRWVVLYWYPRDATPGCTAEACRFQASLGEFDRLGVRLIGVSVDDVERHGRFAARHGLGFPLLADEGGHVAKRYGVLWSFGPIRMAKRVTFLIDPQGRIRRVIRSLNPARHAQQALSALHEQIG